MCILKGLTQPRIQWVLIPRRKIPLIFVKPGKQVPFHVYIHLMSFSTLIITYLFIYLFIYLYSAHILSSWRLKPQSRDSPSPPCNGPKCLTENGEYLVNLYSPYFIVFLCLLVRALECPFESCPCVIGNRQLSKTGHVT